MNILYLTHSYYPAFRLGGPTKSIHLVNKKLSEKKININVITTNAGLESNNKIKLNEWVIQDGVKVKYLKCYGNKLYNISPFMLWEIYKIINKFDIVHISPVWNFPTIVGSIMSYIYKIPYIISPRGTLNKESFDIKNKFLKMLYYKIIAQRIIKESTALHFTSNDEMQNVINYHKLKNDYCVIPNGINKVYSLI